MKLRRARGSRRRYFAQALILLLVAAFVLWRPAAAAVHTAAFVGHMLPVPFKVQRWLTPEPHRLTATFNRHDGTPDTAEVYIIPRENPRAAVLMFLGATPLGYDDPEVVNLGYALARTGFAVMYYWSETVGIEQRLDAGEVAHVVAAFQHLARQDYVDPERLGLAGFSVGASYAMVAAADPRVAADIAFVNSFGGYYDLADLVAQISARRTIDAAADTPWEPDPHTMTVFANTLLTERRSDARDALLEGSNGIQQARQSLDMMPAGFRADVAAISPSQHMHGWSSGTVIRIMHDRGDAVIPVSESRRLVAALAQQRPDVRVYYTETDIFRHVSPDADAALAPLLQGAWRVSRHMYHIIRVAQ